MFANFVPVHGGVLPRVVLDARELADLALIAIGA